MRRRPRGGAAGAQALYAPVAPEAAQIMRDTAKRCDVSMAELIEKMRLHLRDELDDGVPGWWDPVKDKSLALGFTGVAQGVKGP